MNRKDLKRIEEYWDRRASSYDVVFDEANIRTVVNDEIISLANGSHGVCVDIGAGTGRLIERFMESRSVLGEGECHLVDISHNMLNLARHRLSRFDDVLFGFHKCNMEVLDGFLSKSVDLVVSSFAIHHLDDVGKRNTIKEIYRICRPGGKIIIADELFSSEIPPPFIAHEMIMDTFYPSRGALLLDDEMFNFVEWPTTVSNFLKLLCPLKGRLYIHPINNVASIFEIDVDVDEGDDDG